MKRITVALLNQKLKIIENRFGYKYHFDWISNRPRLVDENERNISPRLNKREMDIFLSGFVEALEIAHWTICGRTSNVKTGVEKQPLETRPP